MGAESEGRPRPVFRREGEYWTVGYGDSVCRLRDSAGLRHLAYLLARPGERIAAAELVAMDSGQRSVSSGQSEPDLATTDSVHRTAGCRLPTADSLTTERARVRATHAIKNAMRRIAVHDAELHLHLRATIKTGTYCAYLPDPRLPLEWELGE